MLLEYFRSFYKKNYPNDMEQCIDSFAVFGGFEDALDLDEPLETLIEKHILNRYDELQRRISLELQDSMDCMHLLTAIAIGDRRIASAFKRAHLSPANGNKALDYLRQYHIIELEKSREKAPQKLYPKQHLKREVARHRISHKLRFKLPFLRFWFYFIAPQDKAIQEGNYESVLSEYRQHRQAFSGYIFEELSNLLLMQTYPSKIINSGSYWDRTVEIDLLALSDSEDIIVGECKWRNHKINKKEFNKLRKKCKKLGLTPDLIVLFSKRGFSNELLYSANDKLKLYSAEDFKILLS
ncbi:MAG: DUF234 domain-containing protein [Campylobacterota bacterium]|nr:DUF234 domain-containing protein [Campylobacterota bacterium]